MVLLGVAVRTLPIGTAYAIWVGIGAVGTVIVGIAARNETTTPANLVALACLIASIAAVKLTAPH
jgi:quaternary ammonium compound-resistance protein SugE